MASGGSSSRKRSGSRVWEHFSEIAPSKVRCLHCSMELSYSGRNTTTMHNHMRTKHSDSQIEPSANKVNRDNPELTRKQIVDNSLVDMLVGLRWKLSAVNGEGFQGMISALDPNYVIPSRQELKALRDARHVKPKWKHPTWESSSDSD